MPRREFQYSNHKTTIQKRGNKEDRYKMKSQNKKTEQYQHLFDKDGKRKDPVKFLSKWQDWSEYRRWQELEGSRNYTEKR